MEMGCTYLTFRPARRVTLSPVLNELTTVNTTAKRNRSTESRINAAEDFIAIDFIAINMFCLFFL